MLKHVFNSKPEACSSDIIMIAIGAYESKNRLLRCVNLFVFLKIDKISNLANYSRGLNLRFEPTPIRSWTVDSKR